MTESSTVIAMRVAAPSLGREPHLGEVSTRSLEASLCPSVETGGAGDVVAAEFTHQLQGGVLLQPQDGAGLPSGSVQQLPQSGSQCRDKCSSPAGCSQPHPVVQPDCEIWHQLYLVRPEQEEVKWGDHAQLLARHCTRP